MGQTIDYPAVTGMLQKAVDTILENGDLLTRLDSVIGDGDHGPSMVRAMQALRATIEKDFSGRIGTLLSDAGWAVMSVDAGSTGPLLGSLFMGMGSGAGDAETLDTAGFVAMFAAGIAKMRKSTRAQVGDKTMMDALLPALDAMQETGNGEIGTCLDRAAAAALAGAEATRQMKAKFGRARNLGDRVLGHIDPGAQSMALILRAFSEAAPRAEQP